MTTVTSPAPVDSMLRPYSWPRALLLNYAPGIATVTVSLAVAPLARAAGLPSALGYTTAISVVTAAELAYLRRAARRETGRASTRGAVTLRRHPGWRHTLAWTSAFVAVTAILDMVLAPVSHAVDAAFAWLPTDLAPEVTDADLTAFGPTVVLTLLVINWLLDAVVNATVEELYWKGHLMTRLPVGGLLAPIVTGVLFASEHFWQPSDFVLVALVQVGLSTLAWRTRSLDTAIATHITVNTLATILTALSLFR